MPDHDRGVRLCGLALAVSVGATAAAHVLLTLIGLITNLPFVSRLRLAVGSGPLILALL